MANKFSLKIKSAHIDGTSLSVEGKYLQAKEVDPGADENRQKLPEEDDNEPVAIKITHGYSRDNRPDLKQFTLNLLTTEEEGIPLFMTEPILDFRFWILD